MTQQVIGKQMIRLPSTESTNKFASELLRSGKARHGTVVAAEEQTAGRGQRGRSWHSMPGEDLTASIVLLPQRLLAQDQYDLNRIITLAMVDLLGPMMDDRVRIKWPNDILVGRRKIAGILIKTELAGSLVQSAVVGIGLNVNSLGHEEELLATSIRQETGVQLDPQTLLEHLCHLLEERMQRWEARDPAATAGFRERLWAQGRWADFLLDGSPCKARPIDVDRSGRLIVEHEDGSVTTHGTDRLQLLRR